MLHLTTRLLYSYNVTHLYRYVNVDSFLTNIRIYICSTTYVYSNYHARYVHRRRIAARPTRLRTIPCSHFVLTTKENCYSTLRLRLKGEELRRAPVTVSEGEDQKG